MYNPWSRKEERSRDLRSLMERVQSTVVSTLFDRVSLTEIQTCFQTVEHQIRSKTTGFDRTTGVWGVPLATVSL